MTYFPDLSPAHYGGHLDSSEWEAPLLAIGWLAGGQPYATGTLPQGFVDRLDRLLLSDDPRVFVSAFCGQHACDFCVPRAPIGGIAGSSRNYFIPGDRVVYLVTGGVLHYMRAHGYVPPPAFIAAVETCPPLFSAAYIAAMRAANCGLETPLERQVRELMPPYFGSSTH